MNEMSFAIRVGMVDDTPGVMRGILGGWRSFTRTITKPLTISLALARGGLGFLRDINLGLRPLLEGLDDAIDRGTAMGAVAKSLGAMLGGGERRAELLGQKLVDAAHGSIRLDTSMQLANRAIAAGLDASRDLPVIFDFAAKKAASMGTSMEGLLEGMFTGFARGSTRAFEPLGILQKGVEGVKRDYEAIRGAKTWDQLKPAAQQAEILRQATAEMRNQMGRLGLTGRETVFLWRGIKNSIADSVDRLFDAVAQSGQLRSALQSVSSVIGGMVNYLNKGGSLGDLIWGRKNTKGEAIGSGGLWGGIKAGVLDLGELIGRGIVGGILKALAALPQLFSGVWDSVKRGIDDLLGAYFPKLGSLAAGAKSVGGAISAAAAAAGDWASGAAGTLAGDRKLTDADVARASGNIALAKAVAKSGRMVEKLAPTGAEIGWATASRSVAGGMRGPSGVLEELGWWAGSKMAAKGAGRFIAGKVVPALTVADFLYSSWEFGDAMLGWRQAAKERDAALLMLEETKRMNAARPRAPRPRDRLTGWPLFGLPGIMGRAISAAAMGTSDGSGESIFDLAGRYGDEILSGGIFGAQGSRTGDWLGRFKSEYPTATADAKKAREKGLTSSIEQTLPWNQHERQKRAEELRKIDREIDRIDPGGRAMWLHRRAYQETEKEMRRIRAAGRMTPVGTRRRVRSEIMGRLLRERDARRKELLRERARTAGELNQGRSSTPPASTSQAAAGQQLSPADLMGQVKGWFDQLISTGQAILTALGGAEGQVKRA